MSHRLYCFFQSVLENIVLVLLVILIMIAGAMVWVYGWIDDAKHARVTE